MIIGEVSSAIFISIVTTDPLQSMVSICKGRQEVFYPFDYFEIGGLSRNHAICRFQNVYFKWSCYFTEIAAAFICSNLVDIYFIGRIVFAMRTQTDSVSQMLTRSVLNERKW